MSIPTLPEHSGGAVQTTEAVLNDFTMSFNAEGMGADLDKFNELTSNFREETTKIDDAVKSTIGSEGDGLKGEYGTKLEDLYNHLLGSFNGFSEYFQLINDAGTVVFSTSNEFAYESSGTYRDFLSNQPADGGTPSSNDNNRFNRVLDSIAEVK